jgi:hypothetical protein
MLEQRVLCEACHSLDICQPPCERDETRRRRGADRQTLHCLAQHASGVVSTACQLGVVSGTLDALFGFLVTCMRAGRQVEAKAAWDGGASTCRPRVCVTHSLILSIPTSTTYTSTTTHTPIERMICMSPHASKQGSLRVGGLNVNAEESANKHIELDGMITLVKGESRAVLCGCYVGRSNLTENLKPH